MPLAFRFLITAPMIPGIVGCTENIDTPPIVSATWYRQGQSASLKREQILVLSRWIGAHRAGWQGLMETPPATSIAIGVKYADDREGSFQVWQDPRGSGGMLTRSGYDPCPFVGKQIAIRVGLANHMTLTRPQSVCICMNSASLDFLRHQTRLMKRRHRSSLLIGADKFGVR